MERFRLHSMPHAQCMVEISYDARFEEYIINLVSYETTVLECKIDRLGTSAELSCTGLYSTTTGRHINRFTKEFFGENLYHTIKRNLVDENRFMQGGSVWYGIGDYPFKWETLEKYLSYDYAPLYHGYY